MSHKASSTGSSSIWMERQSSTSCIDLTLVWFVRKAVLARRRINLLVRSATRKEIPLWRSWPIVLNDELLEKKMELIQQRRMVK